MKDIQLGQQLWLEKHAPTIKRFQPIENADPSHASGKPRGGLWTSTWDVQEQTSEWLDWLRGEQPDWLAPLHGWLLTPRPDARLYVVNGLGDLQRCLQEYSRGDTAAEIAFWQRLGRGAHQIDHLALARAGYVGFHVTSAGQARTRLSHPDLYGWDVESTFWYEWEFTDIRPVPDTIIQRATLIES